MKKSQLREVIRKIIKKQMSEAQPAPDTKPTPAPTITPDKPSTEPDEPKRRRIGRPDVEPKPKALSEQDILNKIISRYKAKSSNLNENSDSEKWVVWINMDKKGKEIMHTLNSKAEAQKVGQQVYNRYYDDYDTKVGMMSLSDWNKENKK